MQAALNQYFKEHIGVDIITNEKFIHANEMFHGVTKKGRREGRGDLDHKQPITDEDRAKLTQYFAKNFEGPPSGKLLQEVILFNIIYFMGRRGRENLRNMKKNTFAISQDPDGRKFIYQAVSEHDKNHTEASTSKGNKARIYEQKGKCTNLIQMLSKKSVYIHSYFSKPITQNMSSFIF